MDKILQEDLINIKSAEYIPWNELDNKTILVTGATGLIGFNLIHALLFCSDTVKIIAITRSISRAKERFKGICTERLSFIESDVEFLKNVDSDVDYIIHCAANTASRAFVEEPVECLKTTIEGTINLLEIAHRKGIKSFVFLSSMEVYGYPEEGHKVKENDPCYMNSAEIRSSYPISKIAAESICKSYFGEYGVPIKVLRLTQTFGPGVDYNDKRIFAEFARCVIEKKDIVLHTLGNTKRSYLYTADAVTAIMTTLLKGDNGEIYNAANDNTYCSIKFMAEVYSQIADINITYELQSNNANGYAHELTMDLDVEKIKKLGWKILSETERFELMVLRTVNWLKSSIVGEYTT